MSQISSLNSHEDNKEDSYMSLNDRKVIDLASQNNFAQIKKIYDDENVFVNVFVAKDNKDYSSKN